ncbi:MAG: hypothetical protein GF350_01350, partial [Chitinivibrionales bacterium]|nr:hypothetical protein [Chitinivibrionales bacterium]
MIAGFWTIELSAEPNSAIQLYDSTGANPTSRFGWRGDAQNGEFYVSTPGAGSDVTIKNGEVAADRFIGDGSG